MLLFETIFITPLPANVSLFAAGIASGWNSPTIPRLMAADSPLHVSSSTAAWLIQIPLLGEVLSSLPVAWLSDRLGPKHTLLLSVLPFTAAAALVSRADSLALLFGGRCLFGCAYGIVFTVLPVYLGEIASDRIRGLLVATQVVLFRSGILFTYALAPYVSIEAMACVTALAALVFLLAFVWMPDSPYFLLGHGDRQAARDSLQRLRGGLGLVDVELELDEIERTVRQCAVTTTKMGDGHSGCGVLRRTCAELLAADNRRCLVILLGTAAIVPLSGSEVVVEYAQRIFESIPETRAHCGLDAAQTSIVLAVVQLLAAVVGVCSVDWVGRKPLLIGSSAVAGLCTATVCAYFVHGSGARMAAAPGHGGSTEMAVLAVVALMLFQAAFNAGIDTVTYTLVGELFPANLKAQLSALYLVVVSLLTVAVGKLFQVTSDRWGSEWPFAVFSVCSFAFAAFAVWLIPETMGRSLADIRRELSGESRTDEEHR